MDECVCMCVKRGVLCAEKSGEEGGLSAGVI